MISDCIKNRILIGLALLLTTTSAHAAWEEKFYNPHPLPDDVIMPMPCDGSMVFRKVHIPLSQPLEDYSILLGQDNDEWGYLEQSRSDHIAGSFTETPASGRYYLMAKYETSALQYQAVMSDKCPAPSNQLRLPQINISWMDAMTFSDRYNLWLRKNAAEKLPKEDGITGFLRLPTETEWEFAARGGLSVSSSEFRDPHFPMPEGINTYAWFSGPQSANGKLQLTGLLKPNPLGLHDILGNVSEMTFEPFRLNKLNRPHGQAGGHVVRGGSYMTPQSDLRSALRVEEPYYTETDSAKAKTIGVRLALVVPVLTSRDRIKKIETEWQTLGTAAPGAASDGKATDSGLDQLSTISAGVQDDALRQQLDQLRNEIRANIQLRDEQRDQAIRANLQLGAFLCSKLKDDGNYFDFVNENFEKNCKGDASDATCVKRKEQVDGHRQLLEFTLNYYADTLVDSGMIYNEAMVKPQMTVTVQQMQARRKNNLQSYMNTYWNHLREYWEDGKISRASWLKACKNTN